jgi:cytoskeletal protein CcmA (bactofilin family)
MFSKAKSTKDAEAPRQLVDLKETADTGREPVSKRAASARPAQRSKAAGRPAGVPSIVSSDMIIRGSIESAGEIQFDGEMEGDIRAKGLVIGEGAKVDGEVVAEKVRVAGTVEGAIRASEVELASGAYVKGDIVHTSLSIESGARFEGNCRHSDDPISGRETTAPARPQVSPTPITSAAAATGPFEPAAAAHEFTEAEDVSNEAEAEAVQLPPRPEPGTKRELMPVRTEPAAERTFVKRPAVADLR